MFDGLGDALDDAKQALADLLSGLVEKVTQWVVDCFNWIQRLAEAAVNALMHVGVAQSEIIPLDCGGHVAIDYYVRNPG